MFLPGNVGRRSGLMRPGTELERTDIMTTRWPPEASAGETAGPWGSKGDAMRLVRPLTAAVRPILRNLRIGLPAAGRPEMAPQRIEKIESAPGNGAPMERRP